MAFIRANSQLKTDRFDGVVREYSKSRVLNEQTEEWREQTRNRDSTPDRLSDAGAGAVDRLPRSEEQVNYTDPPVHRLRRKRLTPRSTRESRRFDWETTPNAP